MNSETFSVILVYSTGHAVRAERLLTGKGISYKQIPVPRHLSSDCGSCVRILGSDKDLAAEILANAELETEGIYDL